MKHIHKDRCKGCRCLTCRWKGAGSLCHYNDAGPDASRCSTCENWNLHGDEYGQPLKTFKLESWQCKGYEKRYTP